MLLRWDSWNYLQEGMLACYWEKKLLWNFSSSVFSTQRYTKQRRKQSSFPCHNVLLSRWISSSSTCSPCFLNSLNNFYYTSLLPSVSWTCVLNLQRREFYLEVEGGSISFYRWVTVENSVIQSIDFIFLNLKFVLIKENFASNN